MEMMATDEKERQELAHLLSKDGEPMYKDFGKCTVTHIDLLKRYRSAKPSIEYLLDYVPKIKPRLYSIASSPNVHPEEIHMCIIQDDWITPTKDITYNPFDKKGRYQAGLCSTYLKNFQETSKSGNMVNCKVNAGVVTMPDTHENPMIMCGLGTGIAPIRGMIMDRVWAHEQGQKVGEMALFFGARYAKQEWLYEQQWMDLNKRGLLGEIHPAFSRDQENKIYCQDRIREQGSWVSDWMVNKNGSFYACGSGAVNELKFHVAKAIAKAEDISEDEALKMVEKMQIDGRYNIEAW